MEITSPDSGIPRLLQHFGGECDSVWETVSTTRPFWRSPAFHRDEWHESMTTEIQQVDRQHRTSTVTTPISSRFVGSTPEFNYATPPVPPRRSSASLPVHPVDAGAEMEKPRSGLPRSI